MLKLEQALLVEGKYDAARLANLVDGTILTTDGFRVFRDGALQKLLKRISAAQGLIILTDSDAAGFKIRHFVTGLVGAENVLQAYVPAIPGKESRKAEPGKEGLLGVEGVNNDLILQGLETALASKTTCQQKTAQLRPITYTDLYEWGISGQQRRQPPRLTASSWIAAAPEQKRAAANSQYALHLRRAERGNRKNRKIKNVRNRAKRFRTFLYHSNFQLFQLGHPQRVAGVTGHTPVAAGGQRDRADLRAVG